MGTSPRHEGARGPDSHGRLVQQPFSSAPAQPQVKAMPKDPRSFNRGAPAATSSGARTEPGIILLSFFSGIGVGALATQDHARIVQMYAWEIDESALSVCEAHFKQVIKQRGDIRSDSAAEIAKEIEACDPEAIHTILVLAAPPCPDFSRIHEGPGKEGESGKLFGLFCDLLSSLEALLKGRSMALLVENVIMACSGDINYFSQRLRCEPIIVDAADWGVVHRPRLWWTRVDWTRCTEFKWTRQGRLYRLHAPVQPQRAATFQLRGYELSREIEAGTKLWPCFTTPSPTEAGRPAPKSTRSKIDSGTRQRWLEANRSFAPWHFQEYAMVTSPGGSWEVVPVHLKEQAHLLPPDFTSAAASDHDRHRLLGNSWHRGTASFLLKLVLQLGVHQFGQDAPGGEQHSAGGTKSFESILRAAREQPLPLTRLREPVGVEMYPPRDMWEHWHGSPHVVPRALLPASVEPAVAMTLQRAAQVGPHLPAHREAVLQGLRALVDSLSDETDAWFARVAPHVRSALHPAGQPRFQVLAFVSLLRECGYEGADEILESLERGMPLLGSMPHSPGWRPRTDDTYRFPVSISAFATANADYIHRCLRRPRVDPEWRALLQEVHREVIAGRMEGPFQSPPEWPKQTVDAAAVGLRRLPLPPGPVFVARAFSVCQTGADGSRKVRRCEDYRRSFHNATIQAGDRPEHDDIEVYIQVLRLAKQLGLQPQVWCHDLADAYRAYPVRSPEEAYMLLQTISGPTLWRHRVLPFGSSASVWHFGRLTDAMTWLVRTLLHICMLHYVDDLGGIQDSRDSHSAFSAFSEFCDLLGYRLKSSKAQPPSTRQKLLGVILEIMDDEIRVRAEPNRVQKLTNQIREILASDVLEPEVASNLAGKLGFVQSTAFGRSSTHFRQSQCFSSL